MNNIYKKNSDITVIVPCYMSEKYILITLESILNQTCLPHEVIIVDDGSTDKTVELVNIFSSLHPELNIKLFKNKHKGAGSARNTGLKNSNTKWVAFLDSDDIWENNKIEKVEKYIENNPGKNFICHSELNIKIDGTSKLNDYATYLNTEKNFIEQLYNRNCFSTSAVVCHTKLLLNYDGFDESFKSSQDFELWLRISKHLSYGFIRESLGYYVDRPGNITSQNIYKRYINLFKIACKHREKVNFYIFLKRLTHLSISLIYNVLYK
jgi:glycosyltransferase involved in cell wall biosynthesis